MWFLDPLTPVVDLALQTTCLLILSRTILFIFCSLLLPAQPEAGPTTSGSSFPSLSSLSPTHLPSHPLLSKSVHLEIQYFLPRLVVTHLDIPVGGQVSEPGACPIQGSSGGGEKGSLNPPISHFVNTRLLFGPRLNSVCQLCTRVTRDL